MFARWPGRAKGESGKQWPQRRQEGGPWSCWDPAAWDPSAWDPSAWDPSAWDPSAWAPGAWDPSVWDPMTWGPACWGPTGWEADAACWGGPMAGGKGMDGVKGSWSGFWPPAVAKGAGGFCQAAKGTGYFCEAGKGAGGCFEAGKGTGCFCGGRKGAGGLGEAGKGSCFSEAMNGAGCLGEASSASAACVGEQRRRPDSVDSAEAGNCSAPSTAARQQQPEELHQQQQLQQQQILQQQQVLQQQHLQQQQLPAGLGSVSAETADTVTAAAAAASAAAAAAAEEWTPQQLAVQNAIFEAQVTQYLKQLQFYEQQMRTERRQGTSNQPSRFTEDYRPVKFCSQIVTFGTCRRGEKCTFAHTFEELHPAVADELASREGLDDTSALAEHSATETPEQAPMKIREKREMCRSWARGECLLGRRCQDAHKAEELFTSDLVYSVPVKRGLCSHWLVGRCIFGRGCLNAHGEHEIGTPKPDKILTPGARKREAPAGVEGAEDIAKRSRLRSFEMLGPKNVKMS